MPTPSGTIKGVSELALWTRDLDRSVAFYRDQLGFVVQEMDPAHNAFLRSGTLLLALFVPEDPGTPLAKEYLARTGGPQGDVYHVGFLVDVQNLEPFVAQLRAQGLELRGPVDFEGGRRSYFVDDPDAHCIELTNQ